MIPARLSFLRVLPTGFVQVSAQNRPILDGNLDKAGVRVGEVLA